MLFMYFGIVWSRLARNSLLAKHALPLPQRLSTSAIKNFSVGFSSGSSHSAAQIHTPLNCRCGFEGVGTVHNAASGLKSECIRGMLYSDLELIRSGFLVLAWGAASTACPGIFSVRFWRPPFGAVCLL